MKSNRVPTSRDWIINRSSKLIIVHRSHDSHVHDNAEL